MEIENLHHFSDTLTVVPIRRGRTRRSLPVECSTVPDGSPGDNLSQAASAGG
jgi:hypothetical protein